MLVSGVLAFVFADRIWAQLLEFINQTAFNVTDLLYGQDLSLYFFGLPFFETLLTSAFIFVIIIALLTFAYTAFTLNRQNAFSFDSGQDVDYIKGKAKVLLKNFLDIASKQVGIFLAIFLLLFAVRALLDCFELLYSTTGIVYGAGASDIDVNLKVLITQIGLCVIFAVVSAVAGFKKKYLLMAAGPALVLVVVISGGILHMGYESFFVVPNQFSKEEKYLAYNITSTRAAYGLSEVEVREFTADQNITGEDILQNNLTIENIPINDQIPTKDMYNSLQGIRNYYQFYDVDVDRYMLGDTYTQVFLGAREMNNTLLPSEAATWVNQHLKYTHGFGAAVSPVNKTNDVGQPDLIVKDIPPVTDVAELTIDQPRIYFGEADYEYAVTNCTTAEFDYPQGEENTETFYEGTAGIPMTFVNKLAFSLNYGTTDLLLATEVTETSRILIKRNIVDRITSIAPFLSYDDPYLVISEGRLFWIVDAFTTSTRYPYSQPYDGNGTNYVKNSVKVVVDAYNGDVTFYKAQDEPVLETYSKIFPGFLKDFSEMPDDLKTHVRYSKAMFDIQTSIYKSYHMTNTRVFYNREDQWETALQFYGEEKEVPLEALYIIMKLPQRDTEFMLTMPFTPQDKDNMIAWMAGVSDGDEYGKLVLYEFPKDKLSYGPLQIEQRVDQDTIISPQLTLLGQQGSRILRGNMMTIPIENAIIYVEPVYIQASSGENNLPEVKKVIVCYENEIVMANTLGQALAIVFDMENEEPATETTTGGDTSVTVLAARANTLYKEAIQAQKSGDWTTYGQKIKELETVLNQLEQLAGTTTPAV